METATLTLDLDALCANWRALDALSAASVETAAVVKADGYGLGAGRAGTALAAVGARSFFVALPDEGIDLRRVLGPGPRIFVFAGLMDGWADAMATTDLIPLINSPEQAARLPATLPFGLQLDSGMNRLGIEPEDLRALRCSLPGAPMLVMSHLASSDTPSSPQNADQLASFLDMTADLAAPRSLAATGGTLLGADFHFDLTRPGVGLYGGLPFAGARPVVHLDLPVIQTRTVAPGEAVGYGAAWRADNPTRVATVAAGYADGLIRAMGGAADPVPMYAGDIPCPIIGRVSMDLITVDVTALPEPPRRLALLGSAQTVDDLATAAGTIGYEVLTSLGHRYKRVYKGGD